jgi:aconitate hydratase
MHSQRRIVGWDRKVPVRSSNRCVGLVGKSEGLSQLSAMDRHVIANMGTELGAINTVFPAGQETRDYLRKQGRDDDWRPLSADDGADYEVRDRLDLGELEPLIALPSSPDSVKPVREVAGPEIYQAYIGSSANPATATSPSSRKS